MPDETKNMTCVHVCERRRGGGRGGGGHLKNNCIYYN